MKYCSQCGTPMSDSDNICPKCSTPSPVLSIAQPQNGATLSTQPASAADVPSVQTDCTDRKRGKNSKRSKKAAETVYGFPDEAKAKKPKRPIDAPLPMWQYLLMIFVFSIPVIGFIVAAIFAIIPKTNKNKRAFSAASLIFLTFQTIVFLLVVLWVIFVAIPFIQSLAVSIVYYFIGKFALDIPFIGYIGIVEIWEFLRQFIVVV